MPVSEGDPSVVPEIQQHATGQAFAGLEQCVDRLPVQAGRISAHSGALDQLVCYAVIPGEVHGVSVRYSSEQQTASLVSPVLDLHPVERSRLVCFPPCFALIPSVLTGVRGDLALSL